MGGKAFGLDDPAADQLFIRRLADRVFGRVGVPHRLSQDCHLPATQFLDRVYAGGLEQFGVLRRAPLILYRSAILMQRRMMEGLSGFSRRIPCRLSVSRHR